MKISWIFLLVVISACHQDDTVNVQRVQHSFYHWKTSFDNDSSLIELTRKENVDHLYIHYFDVSWDDNRLMPVPVGELIDEKNAEKFITRSFTPVVFISNSCFSNSYGDWPAILPKKINDKIIFITNQLRKAGIGADSSEPKEIQIDCDWTAGTKDNYFRFLKNFKALNPAFIISVTIRLYPYKYRETMGVPPVDKGLLMCYNLSPISAISNTNSIFELAELRKYLGANGYPIPLDIALPIFGWYAWFSNSTFKGIIYPDENVDIDLHKIASFVPEANNNFRLRVDTVMGNEYLRKGDVVRVEYPDTDELWKAYKLLKEKVPSFRRIAFYHLDKYLINRYEKTIHKIYNDN